MKINRFEDCLAWQKAKDLSLSIYQSFKTSRDYSFKDQIQRAAISVMNNIAEGFERNTNKEFINFLFIAKGSCGEVRSMLILAKELNYISEAKFKNQFEKCTEVSKILSGLIKSL